MRKIILGKISFVVVAVSLLAAACAPAPPGPGQISEKKGLPSKSGARNAEQKKAAPAVGFRFPRFHSGSRSWAPRPTIPQAMARAGTGGQGIGYAVAPNGRIGVTGFQMLERGELEDSGYGLYSYLIWLSRSKNNSPRILAALEAVVEQIPSAEEVSSIFPKDHINILYIPILSHIKSYNDVNLIYKNHDIVLSRQIVSRLKYKPSGDGPILISYLSPITRSNLDFEKVLIQDMSQVQPKLIRLWIRQYRKQVRSPRYWEKDSFENFALHLRNNIALLAVASGYALSAADKWFHGLKVLGGWLGKK